MAVPSWFNLQWFNTWTWFYLKQSYPVYWKMFEPYNISRPSYHWDTDFYTEWITSSYDCSNFQQGNEVYAWTWCISNSSSSSISFRLIIYLDQYRDWYWVKSQTCVYDFWTQTVRWQVETTTTHTVWDETITTTNTTTYANCWYFRWWIDPDEIRPWITQYRLRMQVNYEDYDEIIFTVSNLSFSTTVCNAAYLWVEWSNLCYVPPCIYSWSQNTWYKHKIQYDTWYSWSTWQTPWMIWIPEDSTDHHVYYVTENWVVRRTKETYARPYSPSSTYSNTGSIWMTPSTSSSNEETWYNYICYIDGWWHRRRLGTWDVD